jgi:peptidoglycan/LPS O-acetylase OafA/YrhL
VTPSLSPEIAAEQYRSAKYFPSLDGFRAISILAVVWYHVPELRPYWQTGFLGVHLFFVISGFLITTLLLREKSDYGRISLRNFYVRRTLRIFPAYYLTLGLFLLFCLFVPDLRRDSLSNYLHNLPSFLTYTSNWFVNPWAVGRVIFVAAWSLATEEQFYLFWPWIIAVSKHWYTPVIIMCLLIVANETVKIFVGYPFFLSGYAFPIIAINSVSTAICFGCLLAYALDRKQSFRMAWKFLGQRWSAPVFVAIMIVASLVPNENTLEVGRMFFICITMTLAVGACCIRGNTMLAPLLANRPVRYIGTISYGMYLYHAFGINCVGRYMAFVKQWPIVHFTAVAASTIALASVSYWVYERYFLRLKAKYTAHPRIISVVPEVALSTE